LQKPKDRVYINKMYVVYGERWYEHSQNDIAVVSSEEIAKKIVAEIKARKSKGYHRYPCFYDRVFYKHIDDIIISNNEDILDLFGWKKLLT